MTTRSFIRIAIGITVLSVPHLVAAAGFSGPIIPNQCSCVGLAPGWGCVLQVVQNVINLVIYLATLAATLAVAYAGFIWMTSGGDPGKRKKGRTMLFNILLGLAIVLTAWLLVDFVMKALYNDKSQYGPWNAILAPAGNDQCLKEGKQTAITSGLVSIAAGVTAGTSSGGTGVTSAGKLSDADARSKLSSSGVTIAQGFAAASTLANTREDTINQIVDIKQACGCNVQVNATTGGTHSTTGESHAAGYKVDLQPNASLDTFLKSLAPAGTRGDGAILYQDSCGNQYAREKTHWDITVSKGSCTLGH